MLQNEGDDVFTSDQAQPWPLAFEREGVAAVSSKGHEHDEFASALDTDGLLHFRIECCQRGILPRSYFPAKDL